MNVGILYSGGKDSTFALSWAYQQGWNIRCLITLRSLNPASYMFHTPNIFLTQLQSECLGLPILFVPTIGEKEEELHDLKAALLRAKTLYGIDTLITGAVCSDYQEERINRICQELTIRTFSPLWHKNQEQLVEEMITSGFEFKITAIAAQGLDTSYLGATFDLSMLARFKQLHQQHHIHIAGEGGEFETLVVDCPLFHKRLIIDSAKAVMEGAWNGVWHVTSAHVERKSTPKGLKDTIFHEDFAIHD